ncbi:MAG: ferritin-like domain-containing protein [Actinomycetes bacterium]
MDAPTTTAPPQQPTKSDIAVLQFAQGIELAMTALYTKASAAAGKDLKTVCTMFGEHHLAYAQSIAGLLGRSAISAQNASFYAAFIAAAASGSDAELAGTFLSLENSLVKTHLGVLGTITGTDGAQLVASIISTQGRHAAVLAGFAGKKGLGDILDNAAEPFDTKTYPA